MLHTVCYIVESQVIVNYLHDHIYNKVDYDKQCQKREF